MKRLVVSLVLWLPLLAAAADYESTLLVQTGKLRESDLIVRTISDLQSNKICLAFYVRTACSGKRRPAHRTPESE